MIAKVYHIIKGRSDLEEIVKEIEQHQKQDSKLMQIHQRLSAQDTRIIPYYCLHHHLLFIKTKYHNNTWKLVIPRTLEKEIITDYHIRYGHMGALKVVRALYIKDINRRVRNYIRSCHICHLVKCTNKKKDGLMIPITSSNKLEKVFVDICVPFPRSGGRHQQKYLIIIFDHYIKFTKLYPINRATTNKMCIRDSLILALLQL